MVWANAWIKFKLIALSPQLRLLKTRSLPDFPSGSSINYYQGRFYLIGDDATHVLVLNNEFRKADSIHLFDYSEIRIPKAEKTDLEGSVILNSNGDHQLLIVGSASRKNRKRIILIPFSGEGLNLNASKISMYKTKVFVKRMNSFDILDVNLEGVCLVKEKLLLGNRGNRSNQNNHIIITDPDFWEHQDDARLEVIKIQLPGAAAEELLGLSELCYVEQLDMLLISLTAEETKSSYDDGAIGDSCLGWITGASKKLVGPALTLDGMLPLVEVDTAFRNQKIEGICVSSVSATGMVVHLIADNDSGETKLFEVTMTV
jgi:hypothetical protein